MHASFQGELIAQDEQRMGESLGRSGGVPTQRRALLMTPMVYRTSYDSENLGMRLWSDHRGQGRARLLHPWIIHGVAYYRVPRSIWMIAKHTNEG